MATPTSPLSLSTAYIWTDGAGTYVQPVPAAPTGLNATTISSSQINVGLPTAPSSASQTEWSYKTTASSTWLVWATTAASVTTQPVTGLAANVSYDFRARYSNQTGFSLYSATATQVTQAASGITDGATVSIVGSGFGVSTAPTTIQFLGGVNGPIETATNGVTFDSLALSGWAFPGGTKTTISNTRSYSGTKSLLNNFTNNANFQFGVSYDTGVAAGFKKLYVNTTVFLNNPNNQTLGQTKLIRVTGSIAPPGGGITDDNSPNFYFARYVGSWNSAINVNNGSSSYQISPSEGGGVHNSQWVENSTWVNMQFVFTPDTAPGAGNGSIQWFVRRLDTNAISYGTVSSRVFWGSGLSANPFRYLVLQDGFYNEFNAPMANYIDRDFYAQWSTDATPVKFLLLGNQSTFTGSTVFSVCKYTAWSDTLIQAVVNKGAHASLSGLYWYPMSAPNTPISNVGIPLQ